MNNFEIKSEQRSIPTEGITLMDAEARKFEKRMLFRRGVTTRAVLYPVLVGLSVFFGASCPLIVKDQQKRIHISLQAVGDFLFDDDCSDENSNQNPDSQPIVADEKTESKFRKGNSRNVYALKSDSVEHSSEKPQVGESNELSKGRQIILKDYLKPSLEAVPKDKLKSNNISKEKIKIINSFSKAFDKEPNEIDFNSFFDFYFEMEELAIFKETGIKHVAQMKVKASKEAFVYILQSYLQKRNSVTSDDLLLLISTDIKNRLESDMSYIDANALLTHLLCVNCGEFYSGKGNCHAFSAYFALLLYGVFENEIKNGDKEVYFEYLNIVKGNEKMGTAHVRTVLFDKNNKRFIVYDQGKVEIWVESLFNRESRDMTLAVDVFSFFKNGITADQSIIDKLNDVSVDNSPFQLPLSDNFERVNTEEWNINEQALITNINLHFTLVEIYPFEYDNYFELKEDIRSLEGLYPNSNLVLEYRRKFKDTVSKKFESLKEEFLENTRNYAVGRMAMILGDLIDIRFLPISDTSNREKSLTALRDYALFLSQIDEKRAYSVFLEIISDYQDLEQSYSYIVSMVGLLRLPIVQQDYELIFWINFELRKIIDTYGAEVEFIPYFSSDLYVSIYAKYRLLKKGLLVDPIDESKVINFKEELEKIINEMEYCIELAEYESEMLSANKSEEHSERAMFEDFRKGTREYYSEFLSVLTTELKGIE